MQNMKWIAIVVAVVLGVAGVSIGAQAETSELNIEKRTGKELDPISNALTAHWKFLYERVLPESTHARKGFSLRRIELHRQAIAEAIKELNSSKPAQGARKVLVLGGGYEVDLNPLLENFDEVTVSDLSPEPLKMVARLYKNNPRYHRIRLVQADVSGIPVEYQVDAMNRLEKTNDLQADKAALVKYFADFPKKLQEIPFFSAEYNLVVSPVLVESLPHGPLVYAFEQLRELTHAERQGIDVYLGEPLFYQPDVRDAFARVFLHHSHEMARILAPGGRVAFSVWERQDDKQAQLSAEKGSSVPATPSFHRIGDDRATDATWESFFKPWASRLINQEQLYGPKVASTIKLYVLKKATVETDTAK